MQAKLRMFILQFLFLGKVHSGIASVSTPLHLPEVTPRKKKLLKGWFLGLYKSPQLVQGGRSGDPENFGFSWFSYA